MEDERRAWAMEYCAQRAAEAWAVYWKLRRRDRPRRVRGAAWLKQEAKAAQVRAQQWHAGAMLIGLTDEVAWFYRQARRRRIARPFSRSAEEARRRMTKAPGFIAGSILERIRRAARSGRAKN